MKPARRGGPIRGPNQQLPRFPTRDGSVTRKAGSSSRSRSPWLRSTEATSPMLAFSALSFLAPCLRCERDNFPAVGGLLVAARVSTCTELFRERGESLRDLHVHAFLAVRLVDPGPAVGSWGASSRQGAAAANPSRRSRSKREDEEQSFEWKWSASHACIATSSMCRGGTHESAASTGPRGLRRGCTKAAAAQ
jgi:hypothetical protein